MVCSSCHRRPARRACPALGQEICPACCGSRRLVDIACPPTCGYLAASQSHPAAVVRKQQGRDVALMEALLTGMAGEQVQLTLAALRFTAHFAGDPLFPLTDADVAEAAAALGSTFETAARGLIYEHRPQSLMAQRLAGELRTFLEQARQQRGRVFDELAGTSLRRIADTFRAADGPWSTGGPTARLLAAGRVLRMMGEAAAKSETAVSGAEAPGSLIVKA